MSGGLRVGACQTPEILGDLAAALACVEDFARRADAQGVDLLLFPECFLQGYLSSPITCAATRWTWALPSSRRWCAGWHPSSRPSWSA